MNDFAGASRGQVCPRPLPLVPSHSRGERSPIAMSRSPGVAFSLESIPLQSATTPSLIRSGCPSAHRPSAIVILAAFLVAGFAL
jgi:hypothetical protein